MCSPLVLASVRRTISRRRAVGLAGATVLAAGTDGLLGARAAARQATPAPASGPAASPAASSATIALGSFTRMVDLSHTATPEFPIFPTYEPMQILPLYTIEEDGYFAQQLVMSEHTGTHMDAPAHLDPDGTTADRLSIERFVAPLAVIDVSERAASDPDTQLTPDDILAWEQANGPLPATAFVAMYSGWEARLPDAAAFLNQDADGVLHFPGFHPEAAALLVEERDVVGIGVDTLSLDYGAASVFETHATVLSADKYGLENVANLAEVPPVGATIVVGGPKHVNASGGPTRAFAMM